MDHPLVLHLMDEEREYLVLIVFLIQKEKRRRYANRMEWRMFK